LSEASATLTLHGSTISGESFITTDDIRLVPPGDGNGDQIVDAADYTIWANEFGVGSPSPHFDADFNDDGSVDAADYTIWANHFGEGGGAAGVPEPSTAGMPDAVIPEPASGVLLICGVVCGLIGLGVRRRRRAA
jgi:hypothetical protein